jgi:hypothetical protein
MQHPHICNLVTTAFYSGGPVQPRCQLLFDYLRGGTLTQWLVKWWKMNRGGGGRGGGGGGGGVVSSDGVCDVLRSRCASSLLRSCRHHHLGVCEDGPRACSGFKLPVFNINPDTHLDKSRYDSDLNFLKQISQYPHGRAIPHDDPYYSPPSRGVGHCLCARQHHDVPLCQRIWWREMPRVCRF